MTVVCPCISSESTLSPITLSSQKNWQGFPPIHPACSWSCKHLSGRSAGMCGRWAQHPASILWKEKHYTSPNRASGTPRADNLRPGYISPVTYFFSLIVSLGSLKFNCTLKFMEPDVDSCLSHESSPRTGCLCRSHHKRDERVPFRKNPSLGTSLTVGDWMTIYVSTLHLIIFDHCNSEIF